MRLNGWQRIWVVVCLIYSALVLVVIFVGVDYDEETRVQLSDVELTLDTKRILVKGRILKELEESIEYIELPDGTSLSFDPSTPIDEQERAADEYWKAAQSVQVSKRYLFFGKFAAIWVIPCFTLYILGWAIGWVYRGFK